MRATLHAKLVFRVAQIKGGADALAQFLEVPIEEVQAWMRGEMPVPDEFLFRLFDIFTDGVMAEIGNRSRARGNDPDAQH